MKKWVQLSVVGAIALGLAGCEQQPKKVTLDKTYGYELYDSIGHGCFRNMRSVVKGTTTKNVTVIAYSDEAGERVKTKSNDKGRFTLKLPADDTKYAITAKNKNGKSKPTSVVIKQVPKKYDAKLKLDLHKFYGEYGIKPLPDGNVTIMGDSNPGAYITVSYLHSGKVLDEDTVDEYGSFVFDFGGMDKAKEKTLVVSTYKKGIKNTYELVNLENGDGKDDTTSDSTDSATTGSSNGDSTVDYESLNRNPEQYNFKDLTVSGTVQQSIEGDSDKDANSILLAMNGNSDHLVAIAYSDDDTENSERILEGDNITVNGMGLKTISYDAENGDRMTVPAVMAESITRN